MIPVGPDTVLGVVLLGLGWSYEPAATGCNVRDASGLPVRGLDRDHDGPLTCAETWAVLYARGLVDRDPSATA